MEAQFTSPPMVSEEAFEEQPWFGLAHQAFRNGREAGAHAAGLHIGRRAERSLYTIQADQLDGAVTSVVMCGLAVRQYSACEGDGTVTFQIMDASI